MDAGEVESFETMLRRAVEKRADVRLTPAIDDVTGAVIFVARLHAESSQFREFYMNGVMVRPRPTSGAAARRDPVAET